MDVDYEMLSAEQCSAALGVDLFVRSWSSDNHYLDDYEHWKDGNMRNDGTSKNFKQLMKKEKIHI